MDDKTTDNPKPAGQDNKPPAKPPSLSEILKSAKQKGWKLTKVHMSPKDKQPDKPK